MSMFDALEIVIQLGVATGTIFILLYVTIRRISARRKGRYWTGASVGNALQQLQAIGNPSVEFQVVEKLTTRKQDEDNGDPDDPEEYCRRLRKRVDQTGVY